MPNCIICVHDDECAHTEDPLTISVPPAEDNDRYLQLVGTNEWQSLLCHETVEVDEYSIT